MMQILISISSGNGLVPDGTKPLPGPILTYDDWDHEENCQSIIALDTPDICIKEKKYLFLFFF